MANKYPRQFDNWDKIDPIHFVEAVALWCNINPNDLVKKSLATDKIKDAFQLLLDGKSDGYLGQPFPDDEVFCPDSYWFLKKKDLKAFAKYCDETPVFLFSQKGEEKKYNVPPQPKKTVPDFLKLLKHDSAFVVHEIMMMLFGYDGMEFIILPWQKHIPIYQAKINHIFLLLKESYYYWTVWSL